MSQSREQKSYRLRHRVEQINENLIRLRRRSSPSPPSRMSLSEPLTLLLWT